MSVAGLLNNTCTIQSLTTTTTASGEEVKAFASLATGVPCRKTTSAGREITREQEVVVSTHLIFLPYGQTIAEDYRIVVDGATHEVLFVDDSPGGAKSYVEASTKEIS